MRFPYRGTALAGLNLDTAHLLVVDLWFLISPSSLPVTVLVAVLKIPLVPIAVSRLRKILEGKVLYQPPCGRVCGEAPLVAALHHVHPISWKLPRLPQPPRLSEQGAKHRKAARDVLIVHLQLDVTDQQGNGAEYASQILM